MAAEITDVVVTYKDVMAPVGYRKVTSGFGDLTVAADINHGRGSTQVYLWYASKEGQTPVADLAVVYADEACPDGFRKLDKDLTRGVDSGVFLCLRPASTDARSRELVVNAVTVQYSDDAPPGDGWTKLDKNLNRTGEGAPVYLWGQRSARREPKRVWRADELQVGDYADVLDQRKRWCAAQVLQREGTRLHIHFLGWHDKVRVRFDRRALSRSLPLTARAALSPLSPVPAVECLDGSRRA